MTREPDWASDVLTNGDVYGRAMDVTTDAEAALYLDHFVAWAVRVHGEDPGMARANFLHSVGYWTGYCDNETADRVMKVFKTSHPIFGRRHPTVSEALDAGAKLGKEKS